MRPIRALLPIIRQTSPLLLAREFLWQNWKPVRRKRLLAELRRDGSPVQLRNVGYFRTGRPALAPADCAAIAGVADLVCAGRFPFISYDTAELGFPPSWNLDFISGARWPMEKVERLTLVRYDGSDVKVPWELSRLQVLPVLAKAYRLTGEERYRQSARALLDSWIDSNPVGMGPNWGIAMECALRAISICLGLDLLWPLRSEERAWAAKVTRSLWEHLLFTEAHIEFSNIIRSNHYLSNIVGLLCVSAFLDGPGMPSRRRLYAHKVQQEILRQVLPDGGDYEASTGYHLLVTQMFTTAYRVMRAIGTPVRPEYTARLAKMHDFMAAMADGRGRMPLIGDCDDGRVELLADDLCQMLRLPVAQRHTLDVRGQLGIGQALFGTSHAAARAADSAWYPDDKAAVASQPGKSVALFPDFGVAVARTPRAELLFLGLKNGIGGRGSHTHNDKLSLILRLDGEELLCDAGTGVYTRDPEIRNRFRSTAMHNTMVVSGQEQNTIQDDKTFLFCIGNQAIVTPITTGESAGDISMSAAHYGYRRLGITHRRHALLSDRRVVIEDHLSGNGNHECVLRFHVPAPWSVQCQQARGRQVGCEFTGVSSARCSITADADLSMTLEPEMISRAYGAVASPATCVATLARSDLPLVIRTTIEWGRA